MGPGQVVICREALLPVDLTPAQADCYRLVLARSFDMLADPRPARHSGPRAAQLRAICGELRKVRSPAPTMVMVGPPAVRVLLPWSMLLLTCPEPCRMDEAILERCWRRGGGGP